jgi:sugar phosphate isomerase/epimerase
LAPQPTAEQSARLVESNSCLLVVAIRVEEEEMNEGHAMSRRRFLGVMASSAAATAVTASLGPLTPAWSARRLLPRQHIGVMLYTVRDLMSVDVQATLALISEIGYREVELGGLFGRTPAQFRSLLDVNRLRAIGRHQWTAPLLGGSNPEATLDEAETLGLRYSGATALSVPEGIVPGIGEPQTADLYKRLSQLANEWGAAAAERGIRFYVHNHFWEFGTDAATGKVLYEILLEETDPELVFFELDLFWITFAGRDPLDYLVGNERRFPLFHVKDGKPNPAGGIRDAGFTDLGEGVVDFRRIFSALDDTHEHHYLLERDTQPHPALTAQTGYEYMENLHAAKRGKSHARP